MLPLHAGQPLPHGIPSALHLNLQHGQARSNTASPERLFIVKETKDFKDSVDVNPPVVTKHSRQEVGERF